MDLEINLKKIADAAIKNNQENIAFGEYLKVQDSDSLDKIIHKLSDTITPKIDCLDCGNCCNNMRPIATDEALKPFVEPENIQAYKYLKQFACKNLDGNACKVYENRPRECSEYPYLHRDKFATRTHELRQNYEICPIVYNVFEQLKTELKWVNT
jgi:Fe-S-cluster containining protein